MLKLHLVDLLSIRYSTNFATNTVTNQTDGAYALVHRTYSVVEKVNSCADKNGLCEQKHAPFMGDLSSYWQDLI